MNRDISCDCVDCVRDRIREKAETGRFDSALYRVLVPKSGAEVIIEFQMKERKDGPTPTQV